MTIAAFDCDGTLIRGDATRRFLLELRGPIGLSSDLLSLTPLLLAWRLGRCSTDAFKQALVDRSLQATPHQVRQRVLERLPSILIAQLRPQALSRLRWHQQQGHRCLIVSASPAPLLAPLARHLGVELIATDCRDPLDVGPDAPFALTSANCKGPEKLRRLAEHLGSQPVADQLEAYGDSHGDRELLLASARPHWRSFAATSVPYRSWDAGRWLLPLAALVLLGLGLFGLGRLEATARNMILDAGARLLHWLPALYGLLALCYLGRYARWRLLLGACDIGGWTLSDLQGWFQGFALTATPGKLGELSRVQQLHRQLGYPRLPLVHAFAAERLCDAAAVFGWLAVLLPASLRGITSARWLLPAALLCAVLVALLRHPLRRLWRQWRHHLPQGAMLRACGPAFLVSLVFWGGEGLLLWMLVNALSPSSLGVSSAIGTYLLSGTVGMASTLPGGLGVNEATTILLLGQQGIPAAIALPAAVVRRLITPWSVVLLAACAAVLPVAAPLQPGPDSSP